jgi:hypothetical protein
MVTDTKDAPQLNGGRSRPSFYQRAARESFQAQSSINQKKKSQEVGHAVGITVGSTGKILYSDTNF